MMDIKRIIEIASGLNLHFPDDIDTHELKVCEPLRRAVVNGKLKFVDYLLMCSLEERRPIYGAYREALREANAVVDGVIREGYEDAYRVYEMMSEEAGVAILEELKVYRP